MNPSEEPVAPLVKSIGGDYWSQSRRPLASLLFALPLLVVYEAGVIGLGPAAQRNGADAWLRNILSYLGFREQLNYFLLPVLTVGILLSWHYISRQPWRVARKVLLGMAGESLILAIALWLSWGLYQFVLHVAVHSLGLSLNRQDFGAWLGTVNSYFGAGIYEELLFRMILLNLGIGLLAWLGAGRQSSLLGGVVLSSVLFSAAHYIGPYGDNFIWLTFCFRFLAGAFFAALYLYRGFGIAAGTHALYDVLVHLSSLGMA
jgi:membrane protease YdiL (CAAX protease family)